MYKNIYLEDRWSPTPTVHIWDSKHGYYKERFQNYSYILDEYGSQQSIYGDPVKKKNYISKEDKAEARKKYDTDIVTFETDVRPETRYLVDRYLNEDEPSKGHTILFFDIEVSMEGEMPDVKTANQPITSVAYYDTDSEEKVVLIWDQNDKLKETSFGDTEVIPFDTEEDLLVAFVEAWRDIDPTITTGWNCLDKDTGIWLKDRIVPIKNVKQGQPLSNGYGDIKAHVKTGHKKAYEISLVDGSSIISSRDHIFYACSKKSESYVHPKPLLSSGKDMTTEEMVKTSDDIYLKKELGGNERNEPLTYKKYVSENISKILEYENIDVVISSTKIRDRLKNDHPSLISEHHIPRCYWWGDNFYKKSTHKWAYSNLSEYLDISEVVNMIENSDEITFLMNHTSKTLDLNKKIEEETLHLLGLLYTDGTYDEKQPCVYNKNIKLLESVLDEINNHRKSSYSSIDSLYKNDNNVLRARFNRNGYIGLLLPMIYDTQYKKSLDTFLLSQLTSNQFFSFFGGCVDGDGHTTANSWNLASFINGDSKKIQTLLSWNGIFSTIHSNEKNVRVPCDEHNLKAFDGNLNVKIGYKKRPKNVIVRKNAPSKNLNVFYLDGVVLLKVDEISEIGKREMYDITTESSYFSAGSGVKTHNCDWFDIPYTYRRLRKVFSESFANKLSPIDIVDYNKRKDKFTIAGVSSLDYLQLYKNFTFSQLDSYSLDSVSKHELDEGKIEYKGRTYEVDGETKTVSDLDDLFEYDLERFVEYNMEDVMLLVKLDNKLDFIELARKICHLGHVPYEDIYMSSRYIDGAILTWLHRRGIVAPDTRNFDLNLSKDHRRGSKELTFTNDVPLHIPPRGVLGIKKTTSKKEQYEYVAREGNTLKLKDRVDFRVKKDMDISLEFPGAFVKSPVPGRYEWIYDLDLTSMYPSIIMTINISPETKVGRVFGWDAEKALQEKDGDKEYDVYLFDRHEMTRMRKAELIESLKENDLSIASNGAFYRTDKKGVIPSILEDWFTLRQKYKGTRNEWREKATKISDEEGNVLPNEDEDELKNFNSKAAYYDKLQHVHKILINSVYGVLGLSSFRYYDVDNAQAVTDTGRTLIKFTSKMGDNWYNNALDTETVKSYNIKLDDGSVREIKPTERIEVIREGNEQRVFGCNLRKGDEIV